MSAVLPTVAVSPASAQTVFVDGAVFAAVERRNHAESPPGSVYGLPDQDLSGIVAGGSAALGAWLTPQLSVRVEVGWPAELAKTLDRNYPLPYVTAIGGVSLPYGYRSSSEVRDRARTFSPLIAWHTGRRHGVQLGFIGGAAFVVRTQRSRDETVYPLFSPEVLAASPAIGLLPFRPYTTDIKTTSYEVGAQAGLDADIALGSRLSLVPQVRVIGLSGGLSIRPGVGVRAQF